jgi:3-hydroxyacyl-CoA dehydrogenase/3a,7a,12a-trihydroxy-5b-cholest-24-enoyl-CoA hydratase
MSPKLLFFSGKVAVVTGAGGALGKQYALDLASRGATVIVNDIAASADRVRAVVKEITAAGGIAKENYSDVLDGKEIILDAVNHFGGCDILINNAGILKDKSFHKMTKEEWKMVLDVHLQGTFELCHAAWPIMREKSYGRIVNIGSGAGLYGNFGQANYSAAKMGILGLTNTLAIEGKK